jgi:hypothetical protein
LGRFGNIDFRRKLFLAAFFVWSRAQSFQFLLNTLSLGRLLTGFFFLTTLPGKLNTLTHQPLLVFEFIDNPIS